MIKQVAVALTAGLLVAALSLALALAMPTNRAMKMTSRSSLTSIQGKTAWTDLHTRNTQRNVPARFHARVGEAVQNTMAIEAVGNRVARNIPVLSRYDFATVKNKVLLVNSANKKIAYVINR